jgi:methyltransferase (TIGR00027 family)
VRKRLSSLTATAVATARALATGNARALTDPRDTVAHALLPVPLGLALGAVEGTRLGQRVLSPLLVRASLGMIDHVALRCAAIDARLCAALEAGTKQVLIIGAGLDGRAHRLEALRAATLFEIDHPASQRGKRERAAGLAIKADALRYVPVDLAHESFEPALRATDFDPGAATFAIVEGVLPYLKTRHIEALVRQLAAVCGPGSELVVSYVPSDAAWLRFSRWLVGPALHAIGEPLGDLPEPGELSALLSSHGFDVALDAPPAEFAAHGGVPPVAYERMVLARRTR